MSGESCLETFDESFDIDQSAEPEDGDYMTIEVWLMKQLPGRTHGFAVPFCCIRGGFLLSGYFGVDLRWSFSKVRFFRGRCHESKRMDFEDFVYGVLIVYTSFFFFKRYWYIRKRLDLETSLLKTTTANG
jgi:hypothetical protein